MHQRRLWGNKLENKDAILPVSIRASVCEEFAKACKVALSDLLDQLINLGVSRSRANSAQGNWLLRKRAHLECLLSDRWCR